MNTRYEYGERFDLRTREGVKQVRVGGAGPWLVVTPELRKQLLAAAYEKKNGFKPHPDFDLRVD